MWIICPWVGVKMVWKLSGFRTYFRKRNLSVGIFWKGKRIQKYFLGNGIENDKGIFCPELGIGQKLFGNFLGISRPIAQPIQHNNSLA